MVFSSSLFLVLFLPLFLAVYYLAGVRYRNIVAALASVFFYAWGEPVSCGILLCTCLLDYQIGARLADAGPVRKKSLLALGCSAGLAILVLFKYSDFFISNLNELPGVSIPVLGLTLPIGISFYTFQKITYLVDVYRGQARPARSFLDYILYVSLFPQLIAGPIVRYVDVADQIRFRIHSWVKFKNGMLRFTFGLAKKVLIANELAIVADRAFTADPTLLGIGPAWIGLLAYSLQIYFDFSGYSDMAIGLGSMIGFRFPENFRLPYTALDFGEFWRRWHITLSTFMRDYLYIPLGGSRLGAFRTVRNLWIVFLLSGLWHGASWNFIAWGAYHGFFLTLANYTRWTNRLPRPLAQGATFILVILAWVLFRAETLSHAGGYYLALIGQSSGGGNQFYSLYDVIHHRAWTAIGVGLLLSCFNFRGQMPGLASRNPRLFANTMWIVAGMLFILSFVQIVNSSYNPFIYFRF